MRILFIGDLHFKKNNLHTMESMCTELEEMVKTGNIKLVVCLGDILDTHENISMKCLHMASKFIINLSKLSRVIVLIGNHDRENNRDYLSEYHPFLNLMNHDNITVVYKTIWDQINNFIYVPYVPNNKFKQALETVEWTEDGKKQPHLIFCHQEFKGCVMNKSISKTGDVWSDKYPKVISGHIHDYQVLSNIIYVGTPYQEQYGESEDKAVIIYDTTVDTYTRIRLQSVVRKITIDILYQNLNNFESIIPVDSKDLIRVNLIIDSCSVKELQHNQNYQKLRQRVHKIILTQTNTTVNYAADILKCHNPDQINLIDIIHKLLETDIDTLNIFNKYIITENTILF